MTRENRFLNLNRNSKNIFFNLKSCFYKNNTNQFYFFLTKRCRISRKIKNSNSNFNQNLDSISTKFWLKSMIISKQIN